MWCNSACQRHHLSSVSVKCIFNSIHSFNWVGISRITSCRGQMFQGPSSFRGMSDDCITESISLLEWRTQTLRCNLLRHQQCTTESFALQGQRMQCDCCAPVSIGHHSPTGIQRLRQHAQSQADMSVCFVSHQHASSSQTPQIESKYMLTYSQTTSAGAALCQ